MYFSVHHLYFAKGVYGEDEELLAFQRIMCKSHKSLGYNVQGVGWTVITGDTFLTSQ